MNPNDLRLLRGSLVLVWLLTAFASAWEAHGRSAALLHEAGIANATLAGAMLWGGVALDAAVGLLLWFGPLRLAAPVALLATLTMTLITSAVLPGLWLDPLGALSKNLPILATLVVLHRHRAS